MSLYVPFIQASFSSVSDGIRLLVLDFKNSEVAFASNERMITGSPAVILSTGLKIRMFCSIPTNISALNASGTVALKGMQSVIQQPSAGISLL